MLWFKNYTSLAGACWAQTEFPSGCGAARASGGIDGGIRGDGGSGVTRGQKGKHLKTGKGVNWVGERLCRSDERTEGPAADGDGVPVMAHLTAPEDSCSQWMAMLLMASSASQPEGTLCPQAQADSTERSGRKELGSRKYEVTKSQTWLHASLGLP